MASINKVLLLGHLGKDPETRYMPNGDAVCNITVATSESWKDKATGEKKEATEWHRIVLYRKLGEIAGEYLKKGALVYIEGALKARKWQDKDGIDRYITEIVADKLQMLDTRGQQDSAPEGNHAPITRNHDNAGSAMSHRSNTQSGAAFDDLDDDIPF